MRLESIALQNMGVFAHARFAFPGPESETKLAEIHILTGPNGCGKSTLLHALAAIFDPDPQHHPQLVPRYGKHARVDYQFAGEAGYYCAMPDDPPGLSQPSVFSPPVIDFYTGHYPDARWPFAAFAYSGYRLPDAVARISSVKPSGASSVADDLNFFDTGSDEEFIHWIVKNRTRAALMQVAGETREYQQQQHILQRITDFIADISGLRLRFTLDSSLTLQLEVNEKPASFAVLPEGLKSIISWIIDITARLEEISWAEEREIFAQPLLLFLDEVDTHLHPSWQRRLLPALQKLLSGAQIFISTHSPFVVGSVDEAWIYCLPDPQRAADLAGQEIVPQAAAAGKSYQLILEEVFRVDEQFDIDTEAMLKAFYQLRNQHLSSRSTDDRELVALADRIRERGEELETIIELEMRQLARRGRPAGVKG